MEINYWILSKAELTEQRHVSVLRTLPPQVFASPLVKEVRVTIHLATAHWARRGWLAKAADVFIQGYLSL